jgi:hypothetical protein
MEPQVRIVEISVRDSKWVHPKCKSSTLPLAHLAWLSVSYDILCCHWMTGVIFLPKRPSAFQNTALLDYCLLHDFTHRILLITLWVSYPSEGSCGTSSGSNTWFWNPIYRVYIYIGFSRSIENKNSTSPYIIMTWCSNKHRDNLAFILSCKISHGSGCDRFHITIKWLLVHHMNMLFSFSFILENMWWQATGNRYFSFLSQLTITLCPVRHWYKLQAYKVGLVNKCPLYTNTELLSTAPV